VVLVATLLLIVVKRLIESSSGLKQFVILGLLLVLFFGFYLYFEEIFRILSEYVLAIDRFSRIFYGEDSSYSERIWLIEKGYQIWKESPLFGAGFGQFAVISGFDAYSHNNYIELLVSGGIVAMFLYYILYLLIIYYAFKYKRNELFYAALMVITLLFIDIAAVSFLGRSTMLFIVFTLSHFSRKNDAYVANRSRSFRWNNPK
jgi:O-antigen ligase